MKRVALVLVLMICACSKSEKAPSCAEVTDHVLKLVQVKYPGHGDMAGQGNREQQIAQCERDASPAERRCTLAAKTMEDAALCRRERMKKEGSAKQ
jgi:hypothetical protein